MLRRLKRRPPVAPRRSRRSVGAESRGLDAAGQKRIELVGDKGWQACTARFLINKGGEGVEVCLHQAVVRGFFGTAALVTSRGYRCGRPRHWAGDR